MAENIKKRAWAFVVYPEGNPPAPPDWVEQLQLRGMSCAISPLHDRDVDPTGTPKKPHWHVIAVWGGPTAYSVVKRLTDALNAPQPQPLEQVRGYYRYLTHKDNPEKAQYSESDIKHLNGFDIANFVELTASEVAEIKGRLQDLIVERNLIEYADLLEQLRNEGKSVEWDVASNHTVFFSAYLRSRRHRAEQYRVDPATGEVRE